MNRILTVCMALLFFYSCREKTETAQPDPGEANRKLAEQYFTYFNEHDWKSMADMYVENARFKDPSLGEGIVIQTREQTRDKYALLQSLFPDLRDSVVGVYPSGDKHIIVEFVSKGTAADQSVFQLPICTVFTIENGKITDDYTYYDNFE